jgi:hypothetical protein
METAKEMLNRIKNLKKTGTRDVLEDPGRGYLAAAATGAVVGVFIGLRRRENILLYVIGGAAIAGIAAKIFIRSKT